MGIRCHLPPEEGWGTDRLVLSGREAHHLSRVLRVRRGERVTCFDGRGREAHGVISAIHTDQVTIAVEGIEQVAPPLYRVTLGVAVPGGGRLEPLIDQATQMGASKIIPLSTARGVVHSGLSQWARKERRFRQIAIEAAKQSGASYLPAVHPLTPWRRLLGDFKRYDMHLIAAVQGPHEDMGKLLASYQGRNLLLLIGPEGDFTPEEIEQALHRGAHRIGLGPQILRCETAVVAALAVLSHLLRGRLRSGPP